MYDNLLKYAVACFSAFTIVAMSLMILFASSKEVVYANKILLNEAKKIAEEDIVLVGEKVQLSILQEQGKDVDLIIPLGIDITYENIVIKNDYLNDILYLEIEGLEEGYLEEFLIRGSGNYILGAFSQFQNGITGIELQMAGIYEYSVILKNNRLLLNFVEPRTIYDKIVVIDITTNSGSISTLDIVEKIKILLEEQGIFGYYLDMEQNLIDGAVKAEIANTVNADMLISIDIHEKSEEEFQKDNEFGIKAIYNPLYFIPHFGSIELSDIIERNVSEEIGLYAIGLEAAEAADSLVMEAKVPVTKIEITCIEQEEINDDVEGLVTISEKIASGIVKGVMESYEYLQGE